MLQERCPIGTLPIPSLPCICNWWEHCERLLRYSYNLKIWWSHFLKKYFVVRGGFFLNHVQEVLEYLKSCLSSIICGSGYAHIKAGICWAVAHTINIIGVRINYYWPPPPAAKKLDAQHRLLGPREPFPPGQLDLRLSSPCQPFETTRSYTALRAADLDWIVRLGYSWGGYILGCSQRLTLPLWHSARIGQQR